MEKTETFVDRTGWGDGAWNSEPDKIEFRDETTGYPCLIVRNRSGALCGYVGVPPQHPLHGLEYSKPTPLLKLPEDTTIGKRGVIPVMLGMLSGTTDNLSPDVYFDVHGGITFSGACQEGGHICHIPEPGEPDNVWWFGFDCAHANDLCPEMVAFRTKHMPEHLKTFESDVYRDVSYVKGEIASLAQQLKALEPA